MTGAIPRSEFTVGQVRRLIEAQIVESQDLAEDGRRKALAWVELSDQPGLPELYVFDDVEGGGFRLSSNGQRRAGGYEPIKNLDLASLGLQKFDFSEMPADEELVLLEGVPGETLLVASPKRHDPLLAFRAVLEEEQCLQLLSSLDEHYAELIDIHSTIHAIKDVLSRSVDSEPERLLHDGPIRYGVISAPAPVERTVTIDAMLVPGHVSPTLMLAWLSARYPNALTVESALLEQPEGCESQELCSYFHGRSEDLGDVDLGCAFEDWVTKFGGAASLLRILQSMPAPSGVSAYF